LLSIGQGMIASSSEKGEEAASPSKELFWITPRERFAYYTVQGKRITIPLK